ncbi:MAG: hypothetical protein K0U58_10860 [Gammaproteobacteria bacterium]|nr:hypothetical protein [Gammaproteobacteria bacterium]MDC3328230.1 hypothetical protein [Pseudomonadales bacterium]
MKTRTRGSGNKRLARASPYPSMRIILDYYRLNRADTGAIAVTLRRGAGGPLGDGCVVNPVLGRMDFVPQGRVETSITHEAAYRAILIGLAHS